LFSDSNLVKNKTATLDEHISVLAPILSDISDGSDINFVYKLSASECQKCNNKEHCKTKKAQTKSQLVYNQTHEYVTKAAGFKVFYDPKKRERSCINKSFG